MKINRFLTIFKFSFFFLVFALSILFVRGIGVERQSIQDQADEYVLAVDHQPFLGHSSRIGLNLGAWDLFGSTQFSNNILLNPGLEATLERLVVIVKSADIKSFSDEVALGYPDGYWVNAEFEIRTGIFAGQKGIVTKSLNSGHKGYPQYFSLYTLPELRVDDLVVLTKVIEKPSVNFWKANHPELVSTDALEYPPSSTGRQSIRLRSVPTIQAGLSYDADLSALEDGQNKREIVGNWTFSFWAKAEDANSLLEVVFERENDPKPFFKERLSIGTNWQEFQVKFVGKKTAQPGRLVLSLRAITPLKSIWVDDLFLGADPVSKNAFRPELIGFINECKPSYLREFPHLGDTLENRIADPFARKPIKYHTIGGKDQILYDYSLQEFLSLCSEVKANPWLIIPVTYSDEECRHFAKILASDANKKRFKEVVLEFGTNSWNWLYRPLSASYPQLYGELADRSLKLISQGIKGQVNARFFVSGPFSLPEQALKFLKEAKNAEGLAVSAAFFNTLNKATPDRDILKELFKGDDALMRLLSDELFVKGKQLAISEMGLHALGGNAKSYEQNRVLFGAAAGSGLAKKVLEGLYAGIDPLLVGSVGRLEDVMLPEEKFKDFASFVQNFGPPLRLRPEALSLIMLNEVIGGSMHRMTSVSGIEKEPITAVAFKSNSGWSIAIVSSNEKPASIEIQFPEGKDMLPSTMMLLQTPELFATNEEQEKIKIAKTSINSMDRKIKISIPPWGFVVMTPRKESKE